MPAASYQDAGPLAHEDFVVYLRRGETRAQVDSLLIERLIIRKPGSSAYRHLDGVQAIGYTCEDLDGHRIFTVKMHAEATRAQRAHVDSLLRSSPVAYAVLTDTTCAQVTRIDSTSPN